MLVINGFQFLDKRDFILLQRIFVIAVYILLGQVCDSARNRGRTSSTSQDCEFPSIWSGTWFQKGVHPLIKIEKDIFSFKGKCRGADGHMFFIEDNKEKCFRCVVIYEKHPNVLQYRETYCDSYQSLHRACSIINADAPLYSLFRVDAEPVPCQLRGPFTFTYSRGHGECRNPVSSIEPCTDDSHLLFRFQACADVQGTESSEEELSCLAVWKEGPANYLVGKMSNKKHFSPFSDDNNYRCFVFDILPDKAGIQMSQSADATCDGLVSAWEGSRTMRLTKAKHPTSGCQFPSWVTSLHRWHTLDGKKAYSFSHKNTSFKLSHLHTDHLDTKFICTEEIRTSPNVSVYVSYSVSGCNSGYVCLTFYKRHKHIIEIQMGESVRPPNEVCHSSMSEGNSKEFVTLVAPSPPSARCPKLVETNGLRVHADKMVAPRPEHCRDTAVMVVGCRSHDAIEFLTTCPSFQDIKSFHCHGNWEENGRSYLITGLRNTKTKYCFVYWNNEKMTHLSGIHDTCRRTVEPGVTGNFTYNISSAGHCDTLLNSSRSRDNRPAFSVVNFSLLFAFLAFFVR